MVEQARGDLRCALMRFMFAAALLAAATRWEGLLGDVLKSPGLLAMAADRRLSGGLG